MRARRPLVSACLVLLAMAAGGCASGSGSRNERSFSGELSYVHEFCRAHSMVGVSEAVDRELRFKWSRYEALSVGTTGQRSVLLQQRLAEYSSRWQHLHQRMTTACRDLATCRYRNRTPVAKECDSLRDRLDEAISDGQGFLVVLGEIDLRRNEDGFICPDCLPHH